MTTTPHSATQLSLPVGTYVLDASHSRLGFVARHAMVAKVRGAFTDFEGTATVDGDDLSASSVTVTARVASIDTRNADRDGHLRSGDFFDADTYPTLTFASTEISRVGDDVVRIAGDLTLKGVSRPVSIDFEYQGRAVDPYGNERFGFEGSVVVNRKDWGLTWNAALETGGVLVSEKVTLEFELSAIRQA